MSDSKMQVIFIKQTGHVLAAFTRTADPEGKVKVEDLVATGFPFRNVLIANAGPPATGGELVVLPPEALDLTAVDLDGDTFVLPLNFVTSGPKVDQLGNVSVPAPGLTSTQITINVTNNVPEKTKVWAAVQQVNPTLGEEPLRRVVEGEIPAGANVVILELKSLPDRPPASILNGDYYVIVLVAGQLPHVQRLTVT